MRSASQAKVTMYEAVQTLLDANGEKTADYPALPAPSAGSEAPWRGSRSKLPALARG
jgi:hypothetical protein